MRIVKIWFDRKYLHGQDEQGCIYRQPLCWYPALEKASEEERSAFHCSTAGIHWPALDTDVSFESFLYKEDETVWRYERV